MAASVSAVTNHDPRRRRRRGVLGSLATAELHERYAAAGPHREALRDELLARYRGFVESFARRFAYRGEPLDDLEQVAWLAAVRALDSFDPDLGFAFESYAARCISGALKRHFRDRAWAVRVPRSLLELYLRARDMQERLSVDLGRRVTIPELAAHLGVSEEIVLEAMEVGNAYRATSLDAPLRPGDNRGRDLPADDLGFADVEWRMTLATAVDGLLEKLTPDDEALIRDYFFAGRTQSELAFERGVSQVTVSRRLARILRALRSSSVFDTSLLR